MAHASGRLTQFGRLLLVQRVTELGWPPAQAAERLGVSRATASKWLGRDRTKGPADRSSRPRAAPTRSRLPRSVGCWPPAAVAATAPTGWATTWAWPARPSMGCCAATR
jgi:hypothetical protein